MENTEKQLVNITQSQLMDSAWESLRGRWDMVIPAILVYFVIAGVAGVIPIASVLISGPFALGLAIFSLKIARGQEAELRNIFDGFQNFGNALAAYILMMLVVVLGFILLIVPGIILGFGLSQTMYIMADEPQIGPVDALKKSWEMMKGYKMDYFLLMIRFLPWIILSVFTLFIGLLWLVPYIQVSTANFYRQLRNAEMEEFEGDDDITKHMVEN